MFMSNFVVSAVPLVQAAWSTADHLRAAKRRVYRRPSVLGRRAATSLSRAGMWPVAHRSDKGQLLGLRRQASRQMIAVQRCSWVVVRGDNERHQLGDR